MLGEADEEADRLSMAEAAGCDAVPCPSTSRRLTTKTAPTVPEAYAGSWTRELRLACSAKMVALVGEM